MATLWGGRVKTAEEWIKHISEASDEELSQDVIGYTLRGKEGREVFIMDYDITPIQLDAMKEGMRRAARICFDVQTNRMFAELKVDGAMDCQVTIEQKLEQLTEKDL